MTDAEDERVARARLDDAVDRLARKCARDGVGAATREFMLVRSCIDRLVRVTREAAPRSAPAGDADPPTT